MEKLRNEVIKGNKRQLKDSINNLKKANNEDITNLWYYNEKLTTKQLEKLNKEEITLKEAKTLIQKKIEKEYQKRLEKDLHRLEIVKGASDEISNISITVNWKRSSMWGYNPQVEIFTNKGEVLTGTASGCGYDKESAGIADALNKSNNILKLLYKAKNKKMTQKNKNSHDLLGYGSGYGVLPYFEGGVGSSSLMYIFKKLGFNVKEQHTKKSDYYIITKEV